jgi:4-amino-4-deoxy-L-arabinose transferase-like glycosyltransferase
MKLFSKLNLTITLIVVIALLGSLIIYYSTVWGPWVYSDSTEYIVSARNLIQGHGLGLFGASGRFHPLYLHPPFYSLVLSFFGILGADLVIAARWIDIILFGLTILLLGVTIYVYTKTPWLAIIASFVFLSIPVVVDVFSGAMSEPLFLFTGLASLCLILLFLKNNHILLLITAGVSAGAAMLTRYSGLAFIITGVCMLLIFSSTPWKKRIIDVLTYGMLSCLPTVGWLIWLRTQSLGVRTAPINVNWVDQFIKFRLAAMEIFWSWIPFTSLLPRYSYHLARNILIFFSLLIVILICLTVWKMLKNNQRVIDPTDGLIFGVLMIVLAVAYLFVLAFSYIFTYPPPDLISRTFLPVQFAVILGLFSLILFFIRPWQNAKWLVSVPIFIALVISISYLHDSFDLVSRYHQDGAGYTAKDWRNAVIFNQLEQLPANIPLISNESAMVLFDTNRPAYDISELIDKSPQAITSRFGDDPNDIPQKAFLENGAALVLFNSIGPQFEQLYGDQSSTRLENFTRGLLLYSRTDDGAIYFYPTKQVP